MLQKILCISSGYAVILMSDCKVKVVCSKCETHEDLKREILKGKLFHNEKFDSEQELFKGIIEKYFKYFKSANVEVRRGILDFLESLFVHTDIFFENDNINICLDYFDTSDELIKMKFCSKFKKLVTIILV